MEHQLTILIIEHDTQHLTETLNLLSQTGYATLSAFTGEAGLALAKTVSPEVLLLCDDPPDMPLREICCAIRADARLGDLSIVLFCSSNISEDALCELEPYLDHLLFRAAPACILRAQLQSLRRTEMKQAALRVNQERLLLAIDAVNEGIWDLNNERAAPQLFWNPQYYRILGYEPGELAPSIEQWKDLLHPDDRAAAEQKFLACLEPGQDEYEYEARFQTATREWRWINIKGRVVKRDAEGKVLRMIGTHTDITARKQAEESLRYNEEQYYLLFNGMLEGFALHEIICDADGAPIDYRFLAINGAFETLTGLRREQLIGKTVREVMPATEPVWIKRYGHVALSGEAMQFEEYSAVLQKYYEVRAYSQERGKFAVVFHDVTERKQIESALRKGEERFQMFMRNFPGLAYIKDADSRVIFANQGFLTYLGLHPLDMFGKTNAELFPPEFAAKITADDRCVLESGQNHVIEEMFGGHIWRTCKFAIPQHKEPALLGGFTIDITEQKESEKLLADSEKKFAAAFRLNPEPTAITVIPTGEILDINRAYEQWSGYSRNELLGRTTLSLNLWVDTSERQRVISRLSANSVVEGMPVKVRLKNGNIRDVLFSAAIVPLEEQQILLTVAHDITQIRQTEQALRESEQRLSFALEGTSDALWDWDVRTGKTYFSPRYYTMLGYDPDEFPADYDHWRKHLHPDDLFPIEEALAAHFSGDAPGFAIEFRMKTKQGGWRWILGRGKVVERDAGGRAIRMTGTHTDITERKQAEAEIRRLNAELEQRVQQRTAALEAVNKELQAFAYVVSHDLKTPLRGISQIAYWLSNDYASLFDAEGRELIELMIARVKRMDSLIDGILAYSRIGRVEGASEPVNLSEVIQEALQLLTLPQQITIAVETKLPTVMGDAVRLTQVFENLLSNAIKFMDKPEGHIRIGCVSDGDFWKCYVADNGPGIDPKYHERIFRIFQTLAPRDDHENTGVGLALTQKIIEFYRGNIWVESEPGEGSTFFFTLPK
ncbi:sensor protein fixL [Candidatus Moduliflexus flocculans]|uniref:histidine kinase n=1 Tax=Candidatus Moduliflexus flocculans TaxID=1499966 RepID=A0A081BQ24_9BACT|nr:sensor protein fixL [Candidatus Moduliflexus flocculans]